MCKHPSTWSMIWLRNLLILFVIKEGKRKWSRQEHTATSMNWWWWKEREREKKIIMRIFNSTLVCALAVCDLINYPSSVNYSFIHLHGWVVAIMCAICTSLSLAAARRKYFDMQQQSELSSWAYSCGFFLYSTDDDEFREQRV